MEKADEVPGPLSEENGGLYYLHGVSCMILSRVIGRVNKENNGGIFRADDTVYLVQLCAICFSYFFFVCLETPLWVARK